MSNPAIQCDIVANKLHSVMKMLNKAVKLPLNYLRMVDYMVNSVETSVLQELDSSINSIAAAVAIPDEYKNPMFDLGYAAGVLENLMNCPGIFSASEKKVMQDAINAFSSSSKFLNTSNMFKKYIGNVLYKGAASRLNSLVNEHIIGKLDALSSSYSKMLKRSGITSALKTADALINCVQGACNEIDQYITDINQHYEDLRLNNDGTPKDIISSSANIADEVKKNAVTTTLTSINNIRTTIANGLKFTGGVKV
jgi:hypothetical protein